MTLVNKLTAVADAIRTISGKTDKLTLDEMPIEIATLSVEDKLGASEYPSYVHSEVLDIVDKVESVRKDDSIVFLAMSDSHYPADQTATTAYESNKKSTVQANQAAKVLAYILDIDFFAHLGDVCCGASTTTPDMLEAQINGFIDYFHEAKSDLPIFIAIGNHDNGVYYHKTMTDGANYLMSNEYMYKNFTANSISDNTVMGDATYGGYCYRDFVDKKLRVFLLNTCEESMYYRADKGATLGSQRVWLANALLNLNNKSDASEWGYIVLSHYPADYGATMPLSELFKAYVEGGSITISVEDGTSLTVDFANKNSAKFISQFHGHVHNFKVSKLYSYATGSGVQYDAHRICIPNVQFDRENYYTTVGSYTDINFSEDTSYSKTADTANGTSFVVNVINPSEEKIYSFCYGAGYDRVVGYGDITYHAITRTLSNVATNSTSIDVADGASYSETITFDDGYSMKSMTVTMGGVDITSEVVTVSSKPVGDDVIVRYKINIPEVTGNILIIAKASLRPNFTNLVPYSVNTDGTDYNVDGDGYDNDTYITTNGTLYAKSGYVSTGYIPVSAGAKTIRVAGDGISFDDTYCRIAFYDANFSLVKNNSGADITPYPATNMGTDGKYAGVVTEEDATAMTWEISAQYLPIPCNAPYILVTAKGKGADLIVTVNEEITYGGSGSSNIPCTITQNLTKVNSSNTLVSVTTGESFSATLTPHSGYEFGSVVVTMGGVDVTSSYYSDGVISIPSVIGNIVITATANAVEVSYTNQLPIATDTDGTIYNGVGYKGDSYISSGNIGTKTGYYATGFIPVKAGDTLYFKNCQIQAEQSYHRFAFYKADKTSLLTQNTTATQIGANTKIAI